MIYAILALNVLIMLSFPIVVGSLIQRNRRPGWTLFGVGAVTFVASQIAHIPFNWLVLQRFGLFSGDTAAPQELIPLALFLGLSAGLFEEGARYLTYRFWAKEARSWGKGLMLGAGHGGVESILLGVIVGVNYVVLARMRSGALLSLVPEGQMPIVQAQIDQVFSAPWHLILLGAAERIFAVCFHLLLSLLVMQVFVRRQFRWLLAAVLWHALVNALAVFAISQWSPYVTEAIISAMALISLALIFRLKSPEPAAAEQEPLLEMVAPRLDELEASAEALEKSRYN